MLKLYQEILLRKDNQKKLDTERAWLELLKNQKEKNIIKSHCATKVLSKR